MRAAVSNDLGLISRILSLAPHTMNLQTIHGHTAVMFAATSGSTDALRLLLRVQGTHAADLTLREKDSGLTVVELVERQEEEESREVIREALEMEWRREQITRTESSDMFKGL